MKLFNLSLKDGRCVLLDYIINERFPQISLSLDEGRNIYTSVQSGLIFTHAMHCGHVTCVRILDDHGGAYELLEVFLECAQGSGSGEHVL